METGSYGGIEFTIGPSPIGDTIFMPSDSSGTPGRLNTHVLSELGLTTEAIPSRAELQAGYAIVQRGALTLCFIVTVTPRASPRTALDRGLRAALQDKRVAGAKVMWLPLMGTGAGELSLQESEAITLEALADTGWTSRPGVQIYVSGPDDPTSPELKLGVPPGPPKPPESNGDADANASVFYANPKEWDAEWQRTLEPGEILFWIKRGNSHLNRLKRGHTVVFLAGREMPTHTGGAIIALGVLAAGPEREFTDQHGRRWPVLITHTFKGAPPAREVVEGETGPLVRGAGGVHAINVRQAAALSRILRPLGDPALPFDATWAEAALAEGQTVEDALREHPGIRVSTFDGASEYLSDAPGQDEDLLDRGGLAVALAKRLHIIWCRRNGVSSERGAPKDKPRPRSLLADDTFIVHVDAPWGGGKTTFANFVAQTLNPQRVGPLKPSHFLCAQLEHGLTEEQLKGASFEGVFLGDYSATGWEPHPRAGRRPWIIVRSNAWRYQDVEPPWWQIYLDVARTIRSAALEDFAHCARVWASPRAESMDCFRAVIGMALAVWRFLRVTFVGAWYRLTNTRLIKQLVLTLTSVAVLILLLRLAPVTTDQHKIIIAGFSLDDVKKWTELVLQGIGVLGGGFAALGTVFSQSLSPDIDFSGETKRVGVGDPIARFRAAFAKMLELGRRPILLIVDDLDRCAPKNVVELLRGFQTILQSPRMFVMILGDRNWIETAHSVQHADMKTLGVGSESNLGARFVEKVFQLSFVLPAMSDASRDRYTRAQLGDLGPADAEGDAAELPITQEDREVDAAFNTPGSGVQREAAVAGVIERRAARGVNVSGIRAAAARRFTVATVGDVSLTQRVEKLLAGLAPLLPNNPRQIKRVINAFPLFAVVGAQYFGYQAPGLLSTEASTSRWWQLALWVALSTEWPLTWRRLAAEPLLLDAAYAPKPAERKAALATLTAHCKPEEAAAIEDEVRRLATDPALAKLLGSTKLPGKVSRASAQFAQTRVEPAAVREFNRIIWEAGFEIDEAPVPKAANEGVAKSSRSPGRAKASARASPSA